MENKNNTQQSGKTILQLMDFLSEQSNDSQLGDEFWTGNKDEAADLATRLCITPLQAVLLSICLRRGPRNADFDDIARHLDISNIRALEYSDELNALIRARYHSRKRPACPRMNSSTAWMTCSKTWTTTPSLPVNCTMN